MTEAWQVRFCKGGGDVTLNPKPGEDDVTLLQKQGEMVLAVTLNPKLVVGEDDVYPFE